MSTQASDAQELQRLQQAWMDAVIARDAAALEAIVGPEFTLLSARTDRPVPRDEWLALAVGRVQMTSFRYEDFDIDVFGDAAVVRSRGIQEATVDGRDWSDTFLLTDVWVRRDGRWQVVSRHSSTPPSGAF